MSYRRARKVPIQGNSERCLVLRQQYAKVMLGELEQGRRVINVDESWLNESSFYRKIWASKSQPATYSLRNVSPRISLIAAIDNEGNAWYALNQSNTDSSVMLLFLRSLADCLDYESPGWRDDTVFLLDGARYHTSVETRSHIQVLDLKVLYSAPYSYSSASIEHLFAGLKIGELNPRKLPTGKR